jgi:hypothetical protein
MKLPRLTNIHTVRFTLKSGIQIVHEFSSLSYEGTAGEITSMDWASANRKPFYISLREIAVIENLSKRIRIRVRDAEE